MNSGRLVFRPKLTLLLLRLLTPVLTGVVTIGCAALFVAVIWAIGQTQGAWVFVFVAVGLGIMTVFALVATLYLVYEALSWYGRTRLVLDPNGLEFVLGNDGFVVNWSDIRRLEKSSIVPGGGDVLHFANPRWGPRVERFRRTPIGRLFDKGDAAVPLYWFDAWKSGPLRDIIVSRLAAAQPISENSEQTAVA